MFMPFEEYAQIKAVNWSTLKHARKSPLHYRHAVNAPPEDSARFAVGRLIHAALMQPDRLVMDYVVYEGARRQGKAWEQFEAEHATQTILKRSEWDAAIDAAENVRRHPAAMEWLNLRESLIERAITWTDPATGLLCKALPDAVSSRICDVKSTGTIEERIFRAQAARLGYFGQAAFYRRGYLAITKMILPCALVAVEVDPPHDVGVFPIEEDSLRVADDEISRLLAKVAECSKSGVWPGRYDKPQTIALPAWARGGDDLDAINFFDTEAA